MDSCIQHCTVLNFLGKILNLLINRNMCHKTPGSYSGLQFKWLNPYILGGVVQFHEMKMQIHKNTSNLKSKEQVKLNVEIKPVTLLY